MELDLLFGNWYYYYEIIGNQEKGDMIMDKKIIAFALCTGMLFGATAQAQNIKSEPDTQNIIFTDNIAPETLGICFVVKKGESIDDNNKVYALKNAKSDANGEFEISFVMPETKNGELSDGEYEIYVKESGKTVKKAEFIYASLATRTALLTSVKGISQSETRVDELKGILEKESNLIALKAIGCATYKYNEQTATGICDAIVDFRTVTLEELKDQYNISTVIDDFVNVDKITAGELLGVINPVFESVRFNEITDDNLTDWVASYFTENTYSNENYQLANILYKFNTYVADKLDDLFGQYDETLNITEDRRYIKYDNLSNKSSVNVKLSDLLSKAPAKTVEDLLDKVSKAIPKDNGGGSGGSGGSGGMSVTPPVASTTGGAAGTGIVGFKDLSNAEWARVAVTSLANAGIVSGDENGNFRPNDYVTREEYVKMLVVASGKLNIYATCEFEDVPKDAWYYSYVASAKQAGLTSGINEKEFGTGKALTRQDMAVLSLNAKGEVSKIREEVVFSDSTEIAEYAKDSVSKLYMSGAVNGTGNGRFDPLGKATRAECAQIIYNLFVK